MRLARGDREALLLVGMDVLGDRAAGHAAPVESHDIFAAVIGGCGELDRFAGRRIGELPEFGGGDVRDGHAGTLSCAPLEVPFRLRYHATVVVIAVASGVASVPNVDWYLRRVKHERLLELVGQLDEFPDRRVEQPEGAHGQLRQRSNADRVPNVAGDELEQLAGRDGLRARQVPHAADGALVSAERRQTGRDVRDVAVGVRQVGVADEVSAFAGDGVAEHPLTER